MSVGHRHQALVESSARSGREDRLAAFRAVRRATEELCTGLTPEDCTAQSMGDASPIKWHLAHTSWFFETFLLSAGVPGYRPFHPEFSYLFNSYYNAVGERVARAQRGLITRPSLGEVMRYRRHVDEHVAELLSSGSAVDRSVLELGCHHEQQHQELMLTDLKHLLSLNPLRPAYRRGAIARPMQLADSGQLADSVPLGYSAPFATDGAAPRFVAHEEGLRWIGHAGERFAFDNEAPRHRVFVDAFELASRPATNGEYLAFIADRGYERPELWLSDGWDAARSQGWRAPSYWEERDGTWSTFTLAGMRDLDPDEPVCHVSYFEADAFARWSGARLPREAEWEVAAGDLRVEGNFVESGALHPRAGELAAVHEADDMARADARADPISRAEARSGPRAMFGDVWEWTQSAYCAYPGYKPADGALGEYNGKFMVSQMVLRGGSCASPRAHLRATYRNFFPPAARWQFSGIRLARDL